MRSMPGQSRAHYDPFAIALHWATALLVIVQFVLALTWESVDRPARHLMIVSHLSFGIVLSVILVVRIAWRLMAWEPGARGPIGWQDRIAKAGHLLLYVLLVAEAVLGFIFRWSGGEPMSFFGLLMPSPFAPFSEDAHHSIHAAHEVTGWLIVILAAGHALAALVHHYVLRDDVLKRMLPWRHAIGN